MSVYQKLQQARIKLQAMPLKKSGENKFAGYKYFELGDFLPTIQNIFAEVGLCGIVSYETELASLRIVDIEDNSQLVITSPMGGAAMKGLHAVQNIGAVETYQRRYLWVTAMEIVEHDALEATTGKHEPETTQTAPAKPVKKTISATDGAMDNLDATGKKFSIGRAADIAGAFAEGADWAGFEAWEDIGDNEVKIAVWSLLQSGVRSKIKAMKAESDKPVTA